ncbi:MAG: tRNA (adenosine(37)-N6)-threonylcarbamoyltransferase complex ATPase subunit type 1 TsaE [Prevotellaceae bacterium]|jgi:tRNA threonylcarbamoyladenosine biosynthesis protein TsaE|nr:tRNA (adenosine(37)-N6)-threonylcarbamoyltransferase complex ATPase subunit type 1 TsaE [Prevotellaceae bacterium]
METKRITINGLLDITQAAEDIIRTFGHQKIIAFYGKMGVGKTTLIKAICDFMGVKNVVSSPTFSLINEYHTADSEIIYHFDFYRINQIEEAYDFGYEEYFYSGNYCFIEWPEKIEPLLPNDTLNITIKEQTDGTRLVSIL